MKTYVIGHLKPDTDSVVSALALAELFKQTPALNRQEAEAVITGPINNETSFLLNKFELETPRIIKADEVEDQDQIVLVDHNEANQRLEGMNEAQIVEIIDHHKVNLSLNQPIFMTFKTWGASSTIVYHLMKNNQFQPSPKLAGLMLSAILSDTVGFKSSTCTEKDVEVAKELASIAEIKDLDALTLEIFKAKSDVSQLSCTDIVKNDYKIFDFAGKKVMIDQLETVEQAQIISDKKDCLLQAMDSVKKELAVDLIFVVISDILKANSKILLLSENEQQIAESAFQTQATDQIIDIGAKLSRKKEIAPAIEKAIQNNN
jgi:manganese-dependent inorganic pyrophosphatase